MANINQDLYDKWWLIYIINYMTRDGLYISRFIWQVMGYIYQDLYDKWCLIYINVYMTIDDLYYQDLYDKWWLIYIYIKIYIRSDGLDISRFIWQAMAYIYQDL